MTYMRTIGNEWRGLRAVGASGLIFAMSCGVAPAGDEPNLSSAKRQVNKLVQAIVSRDSRALEQVLSKNLLEAARSQSGDLDATLLAAFEPQRAGLLAQFGEPGELGVESLVPVEGGEVAALLSMNGTTLDRPLYLVLEDGEYRFAGVHPEDELIPSATIDGGQVSASRSALNAYDWPHWLFDNGANSQFTTVHCGNTMWTSPDQACPGIDFGVQGKTSIHHTCPSWQCTFFGSTCTYVWCDPKPCYYQVVGHDLWWDSAGRWHCFQ